MRNPGEGATGRPPVTVASFTASGDGDLLRQLAHARARIETLETQVVRLQAEVNKLHRLVQPLSPDLIDRLTNRDSTVPGPKMEFKTGT